MTQVVERSVGTYCRTPGCNGWAQVGGRCRRCHNEAVARASEIVDRIGIAETLDAKPAALDRLMDDILSTPVEPDAAWHRRKMAEEAGDTILERFEDIA